MGGGVCPPGEGDVADVVALYGYERWRARSTAAGPDRYKRKSLLAGDRRIVAAKTLSQKEMPAVRSHERPVSGVWR